MKKIIGILKNDILLSISALLAVASCFFVLPDEKYISYINLPVLVLLFCLMIVVAGIKSAGVFGFLQELLSKGIKTEKTMIFSLCMICFFSSALITNDVALITFVPFSLLMLKNSKPASVIFAVVMETVSANLGSLITPIGNPQNLYLYTHYNMNIGEFLKITLPLGGVCLVMICVCLMMRRNAPLNTEKSSEESIVNKKGVLLFSALFILCILSVLKLLSCYITLLIVSASTLLYDRKLFKDADYILLLTFVFFFVFAGNVARIPVIYEFIAYAMNGREVVMSALISQVVSNVPASAMLSTFTDDAFSLVLGTNIGGLGTIIASMASLISYRFIAKESRISKGRYMLIFTVYNVIMLAVLLLIFA